MPPKLAKATATATAPGLAAEDKLLIYESEVSDSKAYMEDDSLPLIWSFEQMELTDTIKEALKRNRLEEPTAAQLRGIPPLLSGKHLVIGVYPRSGKTVTYVLPLLVFVEKNRAVKEKGPAAVVICPSRELSRQVFGLVCSFKTHDTTVVACAGGDDISHVRRFGTDILISTPGRLLDMAERKLVNLQNCKILVLDEGGILLSEHFDSEIKKIMPLFQKPQTIVVSSTISRNLTTPSNRRIWNFGQKYLGQYRCLNVAVPYRHVAVTVTQKFRCVSQNKLEKLTAVMDCLHESKRRPALVICTRRSEAEDISKFCGTESVCVVHSGIAAEERDKALFSFRLGECDVLVAVDSVIKGFRVHSKIKQVICCDMPCDMEEYMLRVCNSCNGGTCTTILDKASPMSTLANVKQLFEEVGQPIPSQLTLLLQGKEGL